MDSGPPDVAALTAKMSALGGGTFQISSYSDSDSDSRLLMGLGMSWVKPSRGKGELIVLFAGLYTFLVSLCQIVVMKAITRCKKFQCMVTVLMMQPIMPHYSNFFFFYISGLLWLPGRVQVNFYNLLPPMKARNHQEGRSPI